MFTCSIYRKRIEVKDLNQVFQFTLGIMESGNFYGEKSIYYHVKCLKNENTKHRRLFAPHTQNF
jgi:hypothetical protein